MLDDRHRKLVPDGEFVNRREIHGKTPFGRTGFGNYMRGRGRGGGRILVHDAVFYGLVHLLHKSPLQS